MGCTFLISNPCETPCEMFSVCSTGAGALAVPPTRFGGGALEPGVAIPMRLGAAASGAACLLWIAGAEPPLTTIGETSDLAAVLPAGDEAEPEGLVEADAAGIFVLGSTLSAPVFTVASSTGACTAGCESDGAEVGAAAVVVAACLGEAVTGLAAGAGAVVGATLTGWLDRPWK